MSNNFENALTIDGKKAEELNLDEILFRFPFKFGIVKYEKARNYAKVGFTTAWSPPVNEVHALQRRFPDLDIELSFGDIYFSQLAGTVLANGNLRQDVFYLDSYYGYHDCGHRIWDRTGTRLLHDRSKPPAKLILIRDRVVRFYWYWTRKTRRLLARKETGGSDALSH